MKKRPIIKKGRGEDPPISIKTTLDLKNISFKVTAEIEDWKKLDEFWLNDPEDSCRDFYWNFVMPVIEEMGKRLPRGKNKQTKALADKIKFESPWLYAYFSFWCKRPFNEWPELPKKLVDAAKENDYGSFIRKGSKYSPSGMTQYCMERLYADEAKKLGLDPFGDSDNFYQTYIYADGRLSTIKTSFFQNRTHKEMTNLLQSNPILRRLFNALV